MKHPDEQLADELMRATQPVRPNEAAADSPAGQLREGWLALTQLLDGERAQADAALVARIVAALPVAVAPDASQSPSKASPRFGWLVTGGLAAAMLLGATVALQQVIQDKKTRSAVANVQNSKPIITAWSDPLDEQIALAQSRLDLLQPAATDVDGSLSALDAQLGSFARDLDSGSL